MKLSDIKDLLPITEEEFDSMGEYDRDDWVYEFQRSALKCFNNRDFWYNDQMKDYHLNFEQVSQNVEYDVYPKIQLVVRHKPSGRLFFASGELDSWQDDGVLGESNEFYEVREKEETITIKIYERI